MPASGLLDGSALATLGPYGVAALVVFAVSVVATWSVRVGAAWLGWVEKPRPDRWHKVPRAKVGGIAVFVALVSGILLFVPLTPQLGGLVLLAAFMFGVGLVDDFMRLRPQTKLVAQLAAAFTLFFVGYHFDVSSPYLVDLALVLVWIVVITNAMNLLDNMDGLAAGVAVVAGVFRFLLYYDNGNATGAMLSVVFLAAVAGFLFFNFSPASIFMGDCGSFLIGFFLASLHLTTDQTYANNLLSILFFPVLVLAIPIFDTTLVSAVRWFSGRRVSQGGADHASHRLVAVGLSERRAVLILYTMALASGLVAYTLYRVGFSYAIFGVALLVLGLMLFGIFLSSVQVYPEDRMPGQVTAEPRAFALLTEFRYKRSLLWILVDVLAVTTAYYLGYLFRFGGTFEWERQFLLFAQSLPITATAVLVALFARGLYRSEWKHFSLHEIRIIVAGVTIGVVVTVLLITYIFRFEGYSRAVFMLTWGTSVFLLSGSRIFVRTLADALRGDAGGQRILIYGAGTAGEMALNEIRVNRELDQIAVGFLDDDVFKHRMTINGVPVLGGLEALPFLAHKHRVDAVVVSSRKIGDERLARLNALAEQNGLTVFRVSLEMVPVRRQVG